MTRRRAAVFDAPREPEHWYVGFTDDVAPTVVGRWLLSWLWPGYRHCFAFREEHGGVLMVELLAGRFSPRFFPGATEIDTKAYHEARGACVIRAEVTGADDRWQPRHFSCVDVTRALLGRWGKPQTPYALARELAATDSCTHPQEHGFEFETKDPEAVKR